MSRLLVAYWRNDARRLLKRLGQENDGRPCVVVFKRFGRRRRPDPTNKWQHPRKVREAG
jgi:hypothetical protein